ncbi:MAG: polysaccharide biosynthesis/export family protein [Rhodospirillales bacterium]|nr:polysaccharide biosynthesis/export family protein [Rhodospirillales bacterium]
MNRRWRLIRCLLVVLLAGCSTAEPLPDIAPSGDSSSPDYVIGPLDSLQIFVWRNPEVSTTVPVRPDGRISTPLIEDMQAAGKTPTQLARDIERELSKYIVDPVATVIVTGFSGPFNQQVRVVGEAAKPQAIPYRENMTLLDVMIAVGGLTEFAAGNRAVLIRGSGAEQKEYRVRLNDLLKDGDVTANARVLPGDVLMIPQSWF